MVDDLEEKSPESFDLQHYLGVVRRRHFHFLIPLLLGWAVVWSVSWILAPRYQSATLILVEQPTMPKDYVTPNVSDDLQQRLQSITQQILSRTRLLHIIENLGLYGSDHAKRSADEKVELMRRDINIELVRDARDQINAFNISYTAGDPQMTQQVTSELTNLFINENLEVRQRQSEDTTKFLESQLDVARQALTEQEERVRQYKAQHVGELPEQLASNLQILSGLQSQLQNEQDSLNSAKQQHVYLQTLADQYREFQATSRHPDGAPAGLPAIDQELDRLKAQLADLSAHYTDRHPDVRKVKEQIAKAEKIKQQMQANLASPTSEQTAASAYGDTLSPSPMVELQSQLKVNKLEIENRQRSIQQIQSQIEQYQGRLNTAPLREQQLTDLTRDYDQSRKNYEALMAKRDQSEIANNLEKRQQGQQFRILDPP